MVPLSSSIKKILFNVSTGILLISAIPQAPLYNIPPPQKLKTVLYSLTPDSVAEHLAFYELYSSTPEGLQALSKAITLLSKPLNNFVRPNENLANALIALINKQPNEDLPELDAQYLDQIELLAKQLGNRNLIGNKVWSEHEVLSLLPEQIDLARGLFISQQGNEPDALKKIRIYESIIDLMALQILAKLGTMNATPEQKIEAINQFIFEQMGFRFPAKSRYAKAIDLYTFLPSVLDSHRGVCLGVSILYLCIAQRLNLDLEIITPPGHIYVRYRNGDKIINIETTARGINLDSEVYLGINTRSLTHRNIKEVIGLAHFNQASTFWHDDNYSKAIETYRKAEKYLPDDLLLRELMAYNYLLDGQTEIAEKLLQQVRDYIPDHAIYKETVAEDYLNKKADVEAIKAIFLDVDENQESIEKKKKTLEETVKKNPYFRAAYFQLATAWLQLMRDGEALEVLKKYHELDPNDPTAEYYMTVMMAERLDFRNAWKHLRHTEELLKARNRESKILKNIRKELTLSCPEPRIQNTQGGNNENK
jgi:tetratricopeptide (TPR) repeat protein